MVLTACLIDQLRAGFESSRECPFQKGTVGGVHLQEGASRQQLSRMASGRSGGGSGGGGVECAGMGDDGVINSRTFQFYFFQNFEEFQQRKSPKYIHFVQ